MKHRRICSLSVFSMFVGTAILMTGCASTKSSKEASEKVSLAEMTAPARAVVEQQTAGGKIESIGREVENGKTVYDVEATVGGRHMEYTIGIDGAILGTETGVAFADLPAAVQTAAAQYFGGTSGLNPSKGIEGGQTTYEVEGQKGGKTVAVTFDQSGKLVGEEK